jgi:predicted esterase YcpF (UPF0227 family)
MKIAYINGFNGQNSSKAEWLKKHFNATHIVLENHLNIDEVCKKLKLLKPDIVIASSTGGYIADRCEYDEGVFIYLNPLVEIDRLKTNYGVDVDYVKSKKVYPKKRIVLLNKDDELLDYKKAKEYYKNDNLFLFEKGGHRFKNLDDLKEVLQNIEVYLLKPPFYKAFSIKELKELINKAALVYDEMILISTKNGLYEIYCIDNKIKIINLREEKHISKEELFEVIKNIKPLKTVYVED